MRCKLYQWKKKSSTLAASAAPLSIMGALRCDVSNRTRDWMNFDSLRESTMKSSRRHVLFSVVLSAPYNPNETSHHFLCFCCECEQNMFVFVMIGKKHVYSFFFTILIHEIIGVGRDHSTTAPMEWNSFRAILFCLRCWCLVVGNCTDDVVPYTLPARRDIKSITSHSSKMLNLIYHVKYLMSHNNQS